jgi:protein-tyrosine phosphatase
VKAAIRQAIRRVLPARLLEHLRVSRELGGRAGWIYLKRYVLRLLGLRRDGKRALPVRPQSVLFVCHGNIIRSPMAAALFESHLRKRSGVTISVASAGLHSEPGRAADPRALALAPEFGLSLDGHRTRCLTDEMVERAEAIFVMDFRNEAVLLSRYPGADSKLFLLGAGASGMEPLEIADPYQGSLDDVRACYRHLERRVALLAQFLLPGPDNQHDREKRRE